MSLDRHPSAKERPARQESQLKVDIIEVCAQLVTAFKSNRLPTRGQYTYEYPVALSPPMHIPAVLTDFGRADQIDAIEITLTRDADVIENDDTALGDNDDLGNEESRGDDLATMIGLTFTYPGKNHFAASIASNSGPESSTDLVLNPDKIDFDKANLGEPYAGTRSYPLLRKDVNALFQSIIDPTKNGDYSHTAQFDFHHPEWFQGFVDTLSTRAFTQRSVVTYSPGPKENLPKLAYTEENGNYTTVDVTVPTDTDDEYLHIRTDYQRGGLTMRIFDATRGIIDGDLHTGEVQLDTDELERLHGFLANALGRIKPPREQSLGVLALEQLEEIDPEDLRSLSDVALEQLEAIDPEKLV